MEKRNPAREILKRATRRMIDPRHIDHPRFYTKAGRLTPYAFACGYIEKKECGSLEVRLEMPSPGAGLYHVKAYDYKRHEVRCWETFERLTDARKLYAALKG